jgi:hypothetical protein
MKEMKELSHIMYIRWNEKIDPKKGIIVDGIIFKDGKKHNWR